MEQPTPSRLSPATRYDVAAHQRQVQRAGPLIRPQHLPILIHRPAQLADRLPGGEPQRRRPRPLDSNDECHPFAARREGVSCCRPIPIPPVFAPARCYTGSVHPELCHTVEQGTSRMKNYPVLSHRLPRRFLPMVSACGGPAEEAPPPTRSLADAAAHPYRAVTDTMRCRSPPTSSAGDHPYRPCLGLHRTPGPSSHRRAAAGWAAPSPRTAYSAPIPQGVDHATWPMSADGHDRLCGCRGDSRHALRRI